MSAEKEGLSDKPLHALEEQLARQKAILANKALVQKLPDKGSKIQATVTKLEAEIERKRKEAAAKKAQMSPREVEELEWALGSIPFLRDQLTKLKVSSPSNVQEEGKADNDTDEEGENADELNPNPLKIIATSQISQRQPKPVIPVEADVSSPERMDVSTESPLKGVGDTELDRFTNRIVKTDSKKPKEDTKFKPSNPRKKAPGSSSPAPSTTFTSSDTSREGEKSGKKKYDECLLPPGHHGLEPTKLLSMEETIKIENEKLKQAEMLKSLAAAAPKKVYAYDKLRQQGLLGTYSVEMQTTRPVNPDVDDEDLNQEDDLSDGQITEESDSDDDVEEVQASNQKTSKDLSNLVNASLKLK